jgi:hypothetical protein
MKITFTNIIDFPDLEKPQLASKLIPEWYRQTKSYLEGKKVPLEGATTATIKKCIPVYDAIASGYIITLPADVFVEIKNGTQFFQWANFKLISFHVIEQAPNHPARNRHAYAKFNNPWAVKTPKGYSCLFTHPMHRDLPFTVLPGVVDTDNYYSAVNIVFTMNDPEFEGIIPKGTPIVQVIPFKREPWKMIFGTEKDVKKEKNLTELLVSKFFDRYKTMFWVKKDYR